MLKADPYLPMDATVVSRTEESPQIFTLGLQFRDKAFHAEYDFQPGQFNMLYLYGVGEVAISIVSDPEHDSILYHTIRNVGRVTDGLSKLRKGDSIGIRGPYGRGWPIKQARGLDVVVITGGLGCAPNVATVNYLLKRREQYRHIVILQGVKHSEDFIFREHYQQWAQSPDTEVKLAADVVGKHWAWYQGYVTELIDEASFEPDNTISMICGPELMMLAAVNKLKQRGVPEAKIYLSMERNMECALGHCGHCQLGGYFVCKDGPVFCYAEIKHLLGQRGF